MARQVIVNQDECISCGMCIDNLPDVFRFNDNGKAECFDSDGASEDDIQKDAIDICPVSCIYWE
jgi:ferredoxin